MVDEVKHPDRQAPIRLAIVTPVYNDWASFGMLASAIDNLTPSWKAQVSLFGVDDGSTEARARATGLDRVSHLQTVEIIELACNVGHQRAIAVGLCEVASRAQFDAVVIADCDGEDRPEDIGRLLEAHRHNPAPVIAARRSKRSEGLGFQLFYALYKVLFKLLTGKTIDFGNFCLLPATIMTRLVFMPEVWNHLAASLVRARVRIVRLSTSRGERFAGTSSMNLVALIAHGMSAISVFTDLLFVRLLVSSAVISVAALSVALVATVLRLTTSLAIPGWASTVVGLSAVILFQSLTLSALGAFMMLASRSWSAFIPATHALQFVRARCVLWGAGPEAFSNHG